MMRTVVTQGTGTRAELGYTPVAGKTGTNSNFRDGWFMGFSAHHVTGVWAGNDDNTPMNSSRESAATGGHVAAPGWKRIMDVAEFGLKPAPLPGVPLDPKATPPLTVINDPAVNAVTTAYAGVAAVGPQVAVARAVSTVPDDESQASIALASTPEQADAQSTDVLNNMIDLFQNASTANADANANTDPAHAAAPRKRVSAAHKAQPLAPPPPRRRSFFEFLFGQR